MKTSKIMQNVLVLAVLSTIPFLATAQLEEVKSNQRGAERSEKKYRYTALATNDTVTIKVINPRGEMQALPAHNLAVQAGGTFDFNLNTNHWRPGNYQVIAEGRRETYTQRLNIKDPRHSLE